MKKIKVLWSQTLRYEGVFEVADEFDIRDEDAVEELLDEYEGEPFGGEITIADVTPQPDGK